MRTIVTFLTLGKLNCDLQIAAPILTHACRAGHRHAAPAPEAKPSLQLVSVLQTGRGRSLLMKYSTRTPCGLPSVRQKRRIAKMGS
jgi:hypothetical protein